MKRRRGPAVQEHRIIKSCPGRGAAGYWLSARPCFLRSGGRLGRRRRHERSRHRCGSGDRYRTARPAARSRAPTPRPIRLRRRIQAARWLGRRWLRIELRWFCSAAELPPTAKNRRHRATWSRALRARRLRRPARRTAEEEKEDGRAAGRGRAREPPHLDGARASRPIGALELDGLDAREISQPIAGSSPSTSLTKEAAAR